MDGRLWHNLISQKELSAFSRIIVHFDLKWSPTIAPEGQY